MPYVCLVLGVSVFGPKGMRDRHFGPKGRQEGGAIRLLMGAVPTSNDHLPFAICSLSFVICHR